MKAYHFTILLAIFATLNGCKQVNIAPAKPVASAKMPINTDMLIGKWNLVNDSTSGTGIGPKFTQYVNNYVGSGGDYFDFRSDGKVYIKENGLLDTMSYSMASDTTVIFGKSNIETVSADGVWSAVPTPPNVINPFTAHTARITYTSGVTPGGGGGTRVVNLTK